MDQSYLNNFKMNWQNNPGFAPNTSNVPPFVPIPNPNLKLPFYHTSDPRFKQNITEKPPLINVEAGQKTEDELWIETFLSKVGKSNSNVTQKPKLTVSKKCVKIHVAKSVLHRCLNLLQNLENLQNYLRENVGTISSNEWKEKTNEVGQKKEEFTTLLSQVDDPKTLEQLQRNLNKRKRKRLSKPFKKLSKQKEYEETLNKREVINKNIDKWLENKQEDVEKAKREEMLKRDADCILSEVNKKKSDARKQLALLQALIKLRNIRAQTASANGERINSEESELFIKNTERLIRMWEKALNSYNIEEQGLKVMLESNSADEKPAVKLEDKITNDWETVLFGVKTVPNEVGLALTCADRDSRTFIAVR